MRSILMTALAALCTLALAGCDDVRYDGYGGYHDPCLTLRSCGSCTPVYGCGWCSFGNGEGACLSEPSECRVAQFSWTWEPSGCAAKPDAGGGPSDSGAETSTPADGEAGDGGEAGSADSGEAGNARDAASPDGGSTD